jgi:hypothetical protein
MLREQMSLRNFKGGSWDLRKDDRRKDQQPIPFADRRQGKRRGAEAGDGIQWVTKSDLDE